MFEFNRSNGEISLDADEKVLSWATPKTMGSENSPTNMGSIYGSDYTHSIYNGLMRRSIASDRMFIPDLAAFMPSASADQRSWTFTLRPGLKFSDGSDLNASSVIFSYKVHLNDSISGISHILTPYLSNASIYEIDNLKVRFDMINPTVDAFPAIGGFTFLPGIFANWIISEDHFGPLYDACMNDLTLVACNWNTDLTGGNLQGGAGPFMVDIYDTTNNVIELIRNPHYYMANQIKLDRIVIKTINDVTSAKSAFAAGEINLFDSDYEARADDFTGLSSVTEVFGGSFKTQEMAINHFHQYFGIGNYTTTGANARIDFSLYANQTAARNIRKAMSHLIDRTFISNEVTGGLSTPAATVMPSVSFGLDETIAPRPYDIELSKRYMEAAGFDYTGKTFDAATGAMNDPFFSITILSPTGNVHREQWAAIMTNELPKIGIEIIDHVSVPFVDLYPRTFSQPGPPPIFDEGGYDVLLVGFTFALDFNPTGYYEKSNWIPDGYNVYNYDNITVETAIRDYVNEVDAVNRIPLVKRVQELLYDDQPSIPIINYLDHWAWKNNIIGLDALSLTSNTQEWELVDLLIDTSTETETTPTETDTTPTETDTTPTETDTATTETDTVITDTDTIPTVTNTIVTETLTITESDDTKDTDTISLPISLYGIFFAVAFIVLIKMVRVRKISH